MRACVPLTILEDQQLESLEGLVGEIVGVVDSQGGVTPSVDRVTIQPSNTDINIIDMNSKSCDIVAGCVEIMRLIFFQWL